MPKFRTPKEALRYHVTGAIERGEGTPIVEMTVAHPGAYPGELAEAALAVVRARRDAEETRADAEKAAHRARLLDEEAEVAEALAMDAVAARKRAEAALVAAEANLKRVIEYAPKE